MKTLPKLAINRLRERRPLDAAAVDRRPSRSSRLPRWTWAPAAAIASAEASERASPTTSWPASMSSGTTAEPIQPLAPVTNTRMSWSPVGDDIE